ncbi:hypothetical protein SAMN06265349_101786 [Flavobacterium resistens]|uniref:Uncharacterized protein n=1 Tax=Flavobacterium resistens TaxID=443612 RepID=A0A521B7R5_9FLAO|nr:hypothetical protein [Flavobacterium resistens]MRX70213.1 hypothetical protein [Flavobacterium resistens]SMO43123.1 hypothetical protein SAMN06265349_101786 [Flavobacterium resistens]
MIQRITKTILFFLLSIFISCGQKDPNKQIDEGTIKGETYKSSDIGWTIEIPKGWSVISKDHIDSQESKGKEAIEKSSGQKVDMSQLKHLISFQKNQFNLFASTSEPFKEEYPGEYQENSKKLCNMIYQTYIDNKIKTDSSSGKEIIQGLEFNVFRTTIYAPDGKVILNQIMYNRLINGFDFGVNINYNNDEDKKAMLDAFKNSKFTKKFKQ